MFLSHAASMQRWQVEKPVAEKMESYESSAVKEERLVFLFDQCNTSSSSSLTCVYACNCDTLSPCTFSGLERKMEYSENVVNSLQEYLGNFTDIYMQLREHNNSIVIEKSIT